MNTNQIWESVLDGTFLFRSSVFTKILIALLVCVSIVCILFIFLNLKSWGLFLNIPKGNVVYKEVLRVVTLFLMGL